MYKLLAVSLANWRTTSMGLGLIINGLIHIGYAIKAGALGQHDLQDTAMSILGGIGLIAAGDAGKSGALADLSGQVQRISTAVSTGNTELLKKADTTSPPNHDLSSGPS